MYEVDEMISLLDKIEEIPSLPTIYTKVTTLISNPNSTVNEIARVIEMDQALTSKILRIVNSSFFGFNRKIVSINQAIVLMGFNTIRNTVLSATVFKSFEDLAKNNFDLRRFWRHSIACGIISSILDNKLGTGYKDETFVAGLLHDIGKTILNQYFEKEFGETIAYSKDNNISFYDSERKIIGFSHDEVGEYIAEKWKLPFSLVETIALHHQPENIRSNPKLVSLIHMADVFANRLNFNFLNDPKQIAINPFAFDELELDKNSIPELIKEISRILSKSMNLFSLLV